MTRRDVEHDALAALVPRLALELADDANDTATSVHQIDGSLLSADISGFTGLTETLARQGREGSEIITALVNGCLADLIEAGEYHGGDVIKFGGDAALMLFTGSGHALRASVAAREMQYALRKNTAGRRYNLSMSVGVATGRFHAIVVEADGQRDVLLCGAPTSETLALEAQADRGEVLVSPAIVAAMDAHGKRGNGTVIQTHHSRYEHEPVVESAKVIEAFVGPALRNFSAEYANLGAQHRYAACGFVAVDGVDDRLDSAGVAQGGRDLAALYEQLLRIVSDTDITLFHSDMTLGGIKFLIGAGAPRSVDDPADTLAHAALQIAAIQSPFEVRVGLHVGRLFAGFIGAPHRRTMTLMGDIVNTAARIVAQAGPGEVVADAVYADRTRNELVHEPLAAFRAKGKTDLVSVIRVTRLRPRTTDGRDSTTTMVGRDAERDQLRAAVRSGRAATVTGSAGVGKTRLQNEALGRDGVLSSSGGRYLSTTPYGPFWAPLRAIIGATLADEPSQTGSALLAHLSEHHPALVDLAALIAPVFGAELEPSEQVLAIDPEFRRDALHRVMGDFLGTQRSPLTSIVVEDTQWLDDASTELLHHLESLSGRHRWSVVRSRRTGTDAASEPEYEIVLGPLPDEAIRAIIVEVCSRRLTSKELDRLVTRAQGNPLFAIELAQAATSPGSDLPETVEELIIGRIDRLPPRHRRSVRLASVLGPRFDHAQFAAIANASDFDLEPDLSSIPEIFDMGADGTVEFQQLLYRDVAYASVSFARRKRLHLLIARQLETSVDDVDAIAALLSEHFRLGEDRRRCWKYSILAADRARRQHSPSDAEQLYRRAVDFAPRGVDPNERALVLRSLGECLMMAGSLEEANDWLAKARRLTLNQQERLAMLGLQGVCRERQGRYSDAMRTYTRLIKAADDNVAARIAAYNGRASVLYHQGRARESLDEAARAYAEAEAHDLIAEQVQAGKLMHITAEALGETDALDHAERALVLARRSGALSAEAEILNNLGVSQQLAGDLDAAAQSYRESFDLKTRVGDRVGAAMVQMNLAEVELDRGVTGEVEAMLVESIAEFEMAGFTIGITYSRGLLGRLALAEGNPMVAAERLLESAQAFEDLGAVSHAADMEMLLFEAYIDSGDTAQASQLRARLEERLQQHLFDNPDAARARIERLANKH